MSRIRGVFGYELISKNFIHWLSKYEHEFLGWASCPTLPYSLTTVALMCNVAHGVCEPPLTHKNRKYMSKRCTGFRHFGDVEATRRDYGIKLLVIYRSTSLHSLVVINSLSQPCITWFPSYIQHVINSQKYILTIRRPAVFRHGLDLNHTGLVPSHVIVFRTLTFQFQWMVLGQKTVFWVFVSLAETDHVAGLHTMRTLQSRWIDWHREGWRPLWFYESWITKMYFPLT